MAIGTAPTEGDDDAISRRAAASLAELKKASDRVPERRQSLELEFDRTDSLGPWTVLVNGF